MSKSPEQSGSGQAVPAKMRAKHDEVMKLIEPFSRSHLNDEYFVTIRRLLGVPARKRPSPLANGTAAAWACGIVRTIGWVNFLDDPTQKPHMKMAAVDKAFGVSSGTGQAKSKAIRDMLKMQSFDTDWTLPSRMDDNPMVWMIQVNGLIVDARSMPKEIQEVAFRRGIIPYIPGEQENDEPEDRTVAGDSNSDRAEDGMNIKQIPIPLALASHPKDVHGTSVFPPPDRAKA